jgi:predicted PurR-regulated permease PerM
MSKKNVYTRSSKAKVIIIETAPFVFSAIVLFALFAVCTQDIVLSFIIAIVGSVLLNFVVRFAWWIRHPNFLENRIISARKGDKPPDDLIV